MTCCSPTGHENGAEGGRWGYGSGERWRRWKGRSSRWCLTSPGVSLARGRRYAPQTVASLVESTQSRLFYSVAAPRAAALAEGLAVDVVHPCCAGLDVHKEVVVACVRRSQ